MSHGPIMAYLIYQAKTDVVNRGAPETVSADRWFQPWSLPVRVKPALPASEQQFLAAQPNPVISIPWFNWLSEPVRARLGLAASAQQVLALAKAAPFPESVSEDRWHQPWSEPVRTKPGLPVGEQQFYALPLNPIVPFSSFSPFVDPVRPKSLGAHQQQALAFTAFVSTAISVDGWGSQFSLPQRQLLGLPAGEQQFLAYTEAAPFPETVSEDRWHEPWAEPVRTKSSLPAGEQQAVAFVPVTATQVFEDSWHQGWADPIQLSIPWKTGDNSSGFASAQAIAPTVDSWGQPWAELPKPKSGTTAAVQQALAFAPFTPATAVFQPSQPWTDPIQLSASWKTADNSAGFITVQSQVPSIDGWGSPWSDPPKPKPGTTAALQQFLASVPFVATAIPSVDGWAQPWATPPKPRASLNVAAQQALALDPAVFVPSIDSWQNALAEPVRVRSRVTADAIFFPPNFTAAVAPNFGYFGPFSEPQRQLAGLAARYQQDAAYGFVPIVQGFVFFFGNEEPLPWPGFRGNQFIRENYDSFVLPPFPIPNPPQTQAKFTVSGPSVSDLFPVSGVVYPYAPE